MERIDEAAVSENRWYVAHTKSRAEKKLQQYCVREGLEVSLPCVTSVRKYQSKTARFDLPLFPGYLFVRVNPLHKTVVAQSSHCARLLEVPDQHAFVRQLADIEAAVSSELEVCLAPQIVDGVRVVIKSGPLRGIEGVVEKRTGIVDVLLRLDFIGQAAVVRIHVSELEAL